MYVTYANEKITTTPWRCCSKSQQCRFNSFIRPVPWGCRLALWLSYELGISLNGFNEMRIWHGKSCSSLHLWENLKSAVKYLHKRFAPSLSHLPLINLLIKQNKFTVNLLVSAHGSPTVLPLQSSAVPFGFPGSQEYREVLTAYTLPSCLSLSDFLCLSFIHTCSFRSLLAL